MKSFNANIETFSIFRIFLKILIYVFYFAFLIIAVIILIFIKMFNTKMNKVIKKGIKIVFSGRKVNLRDDVLESMNNIEEKTKNNTNGVFNICLNYGGQEEIVDCIKKIVNDKTDAITSAISLKSNKISITGLAVFHDYKYTYLLESKDSTFLNLLLEEKSNALLTKYYSDKPFSINIDFSKIKYKVDNELKIKFYREDLQDLRLL